MLGAFVWASLGKYLQTIPQRRKKKQKSSEVQQEQVLCFVLSPLTAPGCAALLRLDNRVVVHEVPFVFIQAHEHVTTVPRLLPQLEIVEVALKPPEGLDIPGKNAKIGQTHTPGGARSFSSGMGGHTLGEGPFNDMSARCIVGGSDEVTESDEDELELDCGTNQPASSTVVSLGIPPYADELVTVYWSDEPPIRWSHCKIVKRLSYGMFQLQLLEDDSPCFLMLELSHKLSSPQTDAPPVALMGSLKRAAWFYTFKYAAPTSTTLQLPGIFAYLLRLQYLQRLYIFDSTFSPALSR